MKACGRVVVWPRRSRALPFLTVVLAALCACEKSVELLPLEPAPGKVVTLATAKIEADGTAADRAVPSTAEAEKADTGWWPALKIDSQGRPHLVYCDVAPGDVRYATRVGSAWESTPILTEGSVGKYLAMAIDSHDRPAITYYDQTQASLHYAIRDASTGQWATERIGLGKEIGIGGSLVFDAGDAPHLFYYQITSGKLIHAVRRLTASGPVWESAAIADAVGGYTSQAHGTRGPEGLAVAFTGWVKNNSAVMIAREQADGFAIEDIGLERGSGWRAQLFFGPSGQPPRIIYLRPGMMQLRLAEKSAETWGTRTLAYDVGDTASALAPDGALLVAVEARPTLRDKSPGGVRLLRQQGDRWHQYAIDGQGPAGDYLSLAVDPKGKAVLAYHSRAIHGLRIYDEGL